MNNFIEKLTIENFKSIKKAQISCKRINILIGKPNVGKSNFLEAMSFLGAGYGTQHKFMSDFCRYKGFGELFFDLNKNDNISISSTSYYAQISFNRKSFDFEFLVTENSNHSNLIDLNRDSNKNRIEAENFYNNELQQSQKLFFYSQITEDGSPRNLIWNNTFSNVKKYSFKNNISFKESTFDFLEPPFGGNIQSILKNNDSLLDEFAEFFEDYNLEVIYVENEKQFKIQKKKGKIGIQYSYESIADTFQRFIFHSAAIYSNKDSVILFEEPESHEYPPFIRMLANKIVEDKQNQYFITTHNPYLLNPILEEANENEVALFHVGFKKHETVINEVEKDKIMDYLSYGSDIFFQLK